jgi:hypothetical protein
MKEQVSTKNPESLRKDECLIRPNFEHLPTPLQIDFKYMVQNKFLIFAASALTEKQLEENLRLHFL